MHPVTPKSAERLIEFIPDLNFIMEMLSLTWKNIKRRPNAVFFIDPPYCWWEKAGKSYNHYELA